ncbi:MAG: hypothetical protein ACI909_003498 [Planctomycetota bacterium]|jgi:hypothetical protein
MDDWVQSGDGATAWHILDAKLLGESPNKSGL